MSFSTASFPRRRESSIPLARGQGHMAHYDAIFKNGTIVNQDGPHTADIGVRGGRIAALGSLTTDTADAVTDCKGLHILPGVIDTQVHFREPGPEHKEDLATGSLSAV